jgi:transcriptional regulator with XRE-family HTH domain
LDFLGAEIRNNSLPFPNGRGTDPKRPRDIRGSLKVIENVLLEHGGTFTIVKSALQPECQPKALTLVAMEKHATIADRLRAAMTDGRVSASDLARACGVSPAAVHKWLNGGKMSADNSAAAARALGAREEQSMDEVITLLENLKGPLAALASAIEKIGKSRTEPAGKRERA